MSTAAHIEPADAVDASGASIHREPRDSPRRRSWYLAGLLLILSTTAVVRWQFLESPLERDEGEFAYGGQLLLEGELPYVAFHAMKLPGIYAVYALIEAAFGETIWGIHFGLLLVNLVSIVLVYLLGARLFDQGVGLFAAAAFALLTFSPAVTGTQAQAEHFVLLPALVGALLVLVARDGHSLGLLSLSGVAFGLALLIKQHGAVYPLFGVAYLAITARELLRQPLRRLAELTVYSAAAALPLLVTCAIFAGSGAWESFVFWTFTYAGEYARENSLSAGWGFFSWAMEQQFRYGAVLWIAAVIGLALVVIRPQFRTSRAFVLLWTMASCAAILPGWHFRGHYFLVLYPSLSLCSAVAVMAAARRCLQGGPAMRIVAAIMVLAPLVWPAVDLARFYAKYSPEELPRALYGNNAFAEMVPVGRYLAEHVPLGESFVVLGSEPQLFFYARRRSATPHIYMYPLMEPQPFAIEMQKELIVDIESARPRYIVYSMNGSSWLRKDESSRLVFDWLAHYLDQHYHLVGRVDTFMDRPSRSVWNSAELRDASDGVYWIGIFRRNAGHE